MPPEDQRGIIMEIRAEAEKAMAEQLGQVGFEVYKERLGTWLQDL